MAFSRIIRIGLGCFISACCIPNLFGIGRFVALTAVSGNNQTGLVSSTLPLPLVVRETGLDNNSNPTGIPIAGDVLGFYVYFGPPTPDQGGLLIGTAVTAADGTASVQLTLGNTPGQYQIAVYCAIGICGPPPSFPQVEFIETATATSCPVTVTPSYGPASFPGNGPEHPYVLASFTAPNSSTILAYASSCGFDNFNWQQMITTLPCPSPFSANNLPLTNYCPNGSLTAGYPLGGPPFYDPPPGNYTEPLPYMLAPNNYPFYYSQVSVRNPGIGCVVGGGASPCLGPANFPSVLSLDGRTLSFLDDPADPQLPLGGSMAFSTTLVGVSSQSTPGSVACGILYCTALFSWTWQSTFNGTAGLTSQTSSLFPIDPGSGTGGATITSINGVQLPSVVPPSQVATTASGLAYSRVSQTFNGTVTLTNISSSAISGPLQIVFFGMPPGLTLANATSNLSGTPYMTVPAAASLAPGQSASVGVQFKNLSNVTINLTPVIYSGSIN